MAVSPGLASLASLFPCPTSCHDRWARGPAEAVPVFQLTGPSELLAGSSLTEHSVLCLRWLCWSAEDRSCVTDGSGLYKTLADVRTRPRGRLHHNQAPVPLAPSLWPP